MKMSRLKRNLVCNQATEVHRGRGQKWLRCPHCGHSDGDIYIAPLDNKIVVKCEECGVAEKWEAL